MEAQNLPYPYFSVGEKFEKDGKPFTADTSKREYTRKFQVIMTDNRLGSIIVCQCPGLPLPWTWYVSADGLEYDTLAVLTDMTASTTEESEGFIWEVVCKYTVAVPPGGVPDDFKPRNLKP